MGAGRKDACAGCITRTPYATLVALIMCWAGVGVFCGTMYRLVPVSRGFLVTFFFRCRGVNLTLRLLQDVFKLDRGLQWWARCIHGGFYTHKSFIYRVEPTQLAFVILGASMAALALMILVTAILATGATRWELADVFCVFQDCL